MANSSVGRRQEKWRRRLYIPAYKVGEAAHYARTTPSNVSRWLSPEKQGVVNNRAKRENLSYMQLIEVAIVAAMRSQNVKLSEIRNARRYMASQFKEEHPFAVYKFKTDGANLILDAEDIDGIHNIKKMIFANKGGQYGWSEIVGERLKEFEYSHDGVVVRWSVAGVGSPVYIDPRVSFGAPVVNGIATWAIKGRWSAGEGIDDISSDFDLLPEYVEAALQFEGIDLREAAGVH